MNALLLTNPRELDSASRSAPPQPTASRGPITPDCIYLKLYRPDGAGHELIRMLGEGVALAAELSDAWFFVNYADPDPHLRVRVLRIPQRAFSDVYEAVMGFADSASRQGLVWKTQFDTYQPELDRYGGADRIPAFERLFRLDSDAVIRILETSNPRTGRLNAVARDLSLFWMEQLLRALGLATSSIRTIAAKIGAELSEGPHISAADRSALSARTRAHVLRRSESARHIDDVATSALQPSLEALREAAHDLREVGACDGGWDDRLMFDLLHMHVNRLAVRNRPLEELSFAHMLKYSGGDRPLVDR